MKRKLLHNKSIKTLKSLHKNVSQKRSGVVKSIGKKKNELDRIDKDLNIIEKVIDVIEVNTNY